MVAHPDRVESACFDLADGVEDRLAILTGQDDAYLYVVYDRKAIDIHRQSSR
jgi:hypothetical protein